MKNSPKVCRKGGYTGHQIWSVRFRASSGLYKALQRLAESQNLCVAAVVRGLVLAGLEKNGDHQKKP